MCSPYLFKFSTFLLVRFAVQFVLSVVREASIRVGEFKEKLNQSRPISGTSFEPYRLMYVIGYES